ncbi:GGDEF domain-containing protein [Trinickia dabaoshanensis]|nr:sensor domain-containing diguanylate cyclase [Trinickia dabaoshanensis]
MLVWPKANVPAPIVPSFLPMFGTAIFLTEILTAHLLYTQYSVSGRPVYAALSGAYVFSGVSVAMQLVAFPGVFSATGLAGSMQSAVWIWVFWHGMFPGLVGLALLVRRQFPRGSQRALNRRLIALALIAGGAVFAGAMCFAAITAATSLPNLIAGGSYRTLTDNPVGVAVILANVIAFVVLVASTRLRTLLELWLAVALLAGSVDVILTLHAGARYSVGWYAARIAAVCASSAVLGMLIWEVSHLYRSLHRAHETLMMASLRDGLTKTFNRQYFDTRFPELLGEAVSTGRPLSVLMVDVDYFKQYNDTFGHLAGDDCLRAVATALQSALRRQWDFVARFGGEEFVVVLPNCNMDSAAAIAESLRGSVEALNIGAPHSPEGRVTVSVGVATSEQQGFALVSELLQEADRGLYRAKRFGRNCVAGAEGHQ